VPVLKKLLKLKKWLTVAEAASHLSILLGEEVSEADILRLALDGHLTLSVEFVNGATAQCGKIISLGDAELEEIRGLVGERVQLIKDGIHLGGDKVFSYNEGITHLAGVWDLAMVGAERLDVKHRYHFLTGGPSVESISLDGPFVYNKNGTCARIVEYHSQEKLSFAGNKLYNPRNNPNNYHPASQLPPDAVLVVRTAALQQLEVLVSEPDSAIQRPLGRRERDSLLVIIAALAKIAKVDIDKPSKAAAEIENQTALMGNRVAARTIENHLNRVREARDSRAED
jgi:hypothetical protein